VSVCPYLFSYLCTRGLVCCVTALSRACLHPMQYSETESTSAAGIRTRARPRVWFYPGPCHFAGACTRWCLAVLASFGAITFVWLSVLTKCCSRRVRKSLLRPGSSSEAFGDPEIFIFGFLGGRYLSTLRKLQSTRKAKDNDIIWYQPL
jgi:hypothetical protein